jgi:hypothetical protein
VLDLCYPHAQRKQGSIGGWLSNWELHSGSY